MADEKSAKEKKLLYEAPDIQEETGRNTDTIVWPKYRNVIDAGTTITLQMEYPDGELKGVVLDKRYQGRIPNLTPKQYGTILFRNFDLRSSQSLVFTLQGGIGDFIIAFETILALKEFLRRNSDKRFEFVGDFQPHRLRLFSRFLAISKIFDHVIEESELTSLKTKFQQARLDATPNDVRVEYYSFGSMWDVLWAKWGLPGCFPGVLPRHYLTRIISSAESEFIRMTAAPGFPKRSGYVLLCPETKSNKKMWPVTNWQLVLRELLKKTSYDFVVLAATAAQKDALALDARINIYDYDPGDDSSDFLTFVALVHGARAVLAVDSAPSHVAGHLSKPCVVLWGPSNPTYYGHRKNVNVRLSACPPCWPRQRMQLCQDNVCMQTIGAPQISQYFEKVLNQLSR